MAVAWLQQRHIPRILFKIEFEIEQERKRETLKMIVKMGWWGCIFHSLTRIVLIMYTSVVDL